MKVLINDLPKEERPRERFKTNKSISNEDLIAILLRTGTKNISVKELATKVLAQIDTIRELKDKTLPNLTNIKGIGESKAITLLAALELGKRVYQEQSDIPKKIKNAKDIYNLFRPKLKDKKQEYFFVIFLNNKKEIIGHKLLFKGTLNMSLVHPREIFKEALKHSSAAIICVHNHPSGDPNPSQQDISITKRINSVSNAIGIKLEDHIIIGNNYFSFFENNYL